MGNCYSCAEPLPEGSRFCAACGSEVAPAANARTRTSLPETNRGPAPSFGASGVTSDPAATTRFVPGTIVGGRYRIVGLIGSGGMGEICRADDLKLGQPVALKFLPPTLEQNEDRLNRFLGEVRTARQISHVNICRVYDIGEVDGQHFISMEYVDGEDLASLLRRIGRLPSDKALQIARQLCAGLAAAHDKGILHRDLKPANVMLDGRGQVRITDFGLAALADQVTGAEVRAGTPDYMAPEQLDGREVTVRSDVYGLGLVLYELFTGKAAYQADTLAELRRLKSETSPASPVSLVDQLDPAIERAILLCLEPRPEDRPASALAVAASLPGGDPLAAALAAGETPSPEMVAAAGPRGGMRPGTALVMLALFVLGVLGMALWNERTTIVGLVPIDRPMAALADSARRMVNELGLTEPPVDSVSRYAPDQETLKYCAEQDLGPKRWDPLTEDGQTALYFWYRQSSRHLVPVNLAGIVTHNDPSLRPGDVNLILDLRGRLTFFESRPPRVDHDPDLEAEGGWAKLFAAAALDIEQFSPVTPIVQPRVYGNMRRAWTGTLPHRGDLPVRVEAASFAGLPVHFELITPLDSEWSEAIEQAREQTGLSRGLTLFALLLLIGIVGAGVYFALRNWRLGRGDRRGALRLAVAVFLLWMCHWLVAGHHVVDVGGELMLAVITLGLAMVFGLIAWVFYVALEPYARRLWPKGLVSWTRLLAGRLRDPLVGRDLLTGCLFAVGFEVLIAVGRLAPGWLNLPPVVPMPFGIGALGGGRVAVGAMFTAPLVGLQFALFYFMIFLMFRIVLRRTLVAVVAFTLLVVGLNAVGYALPVGGEEMSGGMMALGGVLGVVDAVILAALIIRFGLLTLAANFTMLNLLGTFPITLDPAAPYFTTSLVGMGLAVAFAGFAFHTSLAGQRLFQDRLLTQQTAAR